MVRWLDLDIEAFLDSADRFRADPLYVYKVTERPPRNRGSSHRSSKGDEIARLEIVYVSGGVRHAFIYVAPWAGHLREARRGSRFLGSPAPRLPISEHDLAFLNSSLVRQGRALAKSFPRSVRDYGERIPNPGNELEVRGAFLSYLGRKLNLSSLQSGPNDPDGIFPLPSIPARSKAAKRVRRLVTEIIRDLRSRDRKLVGSLKGSCANWADRESIPLRSLQLNRISEFLDTKGVHLSDQGIRDLRDAATAILKVKREYRSHH